MTTLSKLIASLLIAAGVAASASAATVTYSSRAAFEAALTGVTVDNLNGVSYAVFSGDEVRPGYTISTAQMYGCASEFDCGDNSSRGITYSGTGTSYIWNYNADDTFTFDTAVNGFGFDFADPACCETGARAVINGEEAGETFGFFGIVSDVSLNVFTVGQTGGYMVMDNITYGSLGTPSDVPEPALPALVGIALLGLAVARRRKQQ